MRPDIKLLASKWIAETTRASSHGQLPNESDAWTATDIVMHLPHEDPGEAWKFVAEVLATSTDPAVLNSLGAGVLESVIAQDSSNAVIRLRELSVHHDALLIALGAAWQNATPSGVWAEVEKLRSQIG